jgi:cytochrome c oxidase assembly protein subunit 15
MVYASPDERRVHRSAALVSGFGATVAMWGAGFVARLPAISAPGSILFFLLLLCLLGGGYVAGRTTGSARAGLLSGLLAAFLNLLILGSVLGSPEGANEFKPNAALYVPGFLLLGTSLGWLGGLAGARAGTRSRQDWGSHLAHIAAVATLLLLSVGGLVTTKGAGMDVPDWPGSFGYNMFTFPLERMTGGVYYEHTHRLFGTLVGLTSLVLAIYIQRTESRGWVKKFAWIVFALICVQGVLGGIRVTENSTGLAALHGVIGQVIFALIVGITAVATRAFRTGPPPREAAGVGTERFLGWLLVILFLAQIAVGALLRHFQALLHAHISLAVVVILVSGFAGFRAWGLYPDIKVLKKVGIVLLVLAGLQLVLGFAALIFAWGEPNHRARDAFATLIITLHQAVGALLLATVTLQWIWVRRSLTAEADPG